MTFFGYAQTTKAIANKSEEICTFFDDKVIKPFTDKQGHKIMPSSMFVPDLSTLEIPSPAIPPSHPLIQKAQHLISEYDYFSDTMPYSIWISGTNGKTTTTQMLLHLLKDKGAVAGGNIGTPLANLDKNAPIWILETSSFTLHYTNKAKANLYILLPITPDHLDWHGGFEAYEADKLKPIKMLKEGEIALVPKKYLNTSTYGHLIGYNNADDLSQYFKIDKEALRFKGAFLNDALLALAVSKILFDTIDIDLMNQFVIEEHRQELLEDYRSRVWINDTKATNIDASLQVIDLYKNKKIHLIVGGDDKGVDNNPLFEFIKNLDIALYTIGKNETVLNTLAKKYNVSCTPCSTLVNAIGVIDTLHTNQSVAILAPAAASLDQFKSYKERGTLFKNTIKNLKD